MSDAAKKDAKASEKPPVVENTENLKILAAIGYLGILFLVPYLTNPKSEFAVFHANQGLLLFIAAAIVNIAGMIPIIGWFIILPVGNILVLVLFIIGIVSALQGQMKRLPVIGGYDLLKVEK